MSAAVAITQPSAVTSAAPMTERDRNLAEMRAFVTRRKPHSHAEALRLLRHAYPQAPLSLRVAACGLS